MASSKLALLEKTPTKAGIGNGFVQTSFVGENSNKGAEGELQQMRGKSPDSFAGENSNKGGKGGNRKWLRPN